MDNCPDLKLKCVVNEYKDMADTFYREKVENSIEFKVTEIQRQSSSPYFITASKNGSVPGV